MLFYLKYNVGLSFVEAVFCEDHFPLEHPSTKLRVTASVNDMIASFKQQGPGGPAVLMTYLQSLLISSMI